MNLLDVWKAETRLARRFGRATRKVLEEYFEYRDTRPLLEQLERNIMSQIERLQSAVSAQSDAITQMQQRVHEDVETLRTELADALAEKPELDELLTRIEENTGTINTIDPVVQDVIDSGEVIPPEETGGDEPVDELPDEEIPVDELPDEGEPADGEPVDELPEDSPTPDTDEVPTGGPVEDDGGTDGGADEFPADDAPVEDENV